MVGSYGGALAFIARNRLFVNAMPPAPRDASLPQGMRAQGELLLTSPASVDLLRLEEAPAELAARVRSEGQLLWTQEGA